MIIAGLISLAWGYIRGDLFKFIRTTLRMLNAAESELGLSKELGMSIGAYASLLMAVPSFQRAIYYHNRALEMRRELQDEWASPSLQWLAYCMQWKGDFEESNRLFFDSISRFQKIGDLWEKGMNEQGIEMNYIYLGQYEDAMNYLHNYLRTCEQIDDVYGITGAYVDFQWLNTERGDYTMTKKWADKAIDLSIANKIYFSLANSFCYTAEQHILHGQLPRCGRPAP
jgi:tetratricopeptide (TPR) repeat protein